jgi:beta-phosphoglucomutase-like phosphatase (HAD superfamily)
VRYRAEQNGRRILVEGEGDHHQPAHRASGRLATACPALEMLGFGPEVPVITRDQVHRAKPDPDLFIAAAERLGALMSTSVVVGDSVWDLLAARRATARSTPVSCLEATDRMSSSEPVRTGYIRILTIC